MSQQQRYNPEGFREEVAEPTAGLAIGDVPLMKATSPSEGGFVSLPMPTLTPSAGGPPQQPSASLTLEPLSTAHRQGSSYLAAPQQHQQHPFHAPPPLPLARGVVSNNNTAPPPMLMSSNGSRLPMGAAPPQSLGGTPPCILNTSSTTHDDVLRSSGVGGGVGGGGACSSGSVSIGNARRRSANTTTTVGGGAGSAVVVTRIGPQGHGETALRVDSLTAIGAGNMYRSTTAAAASGIRGPYHPHTHGVAHFGGGYDPNYYGSGGGIDGNATTADHDGIEEKAFFRPEGLSDESDKNDNDDDDSMMGAAIRDDGCDDVGHSNINAPPHDAHDESLSAANMPTRGASGLPGHLPANDDHVSGSTSQQPQGNATTAAAAALVGSMSVRAARSARRDRSQLGRRSVAGAGGEGSLVYDLPHVDRVPSAIARPTRSQLLRQRAARKAEQEKAAALANGTPYPPPPAVVAGGGEGGGQQHVADPPPPTPHQADTNSHNSSNLTDRDEFEISVKCRLQFSPWPTFWLCCRYESDEMEHRFLHFYYAEGRSLLFFGVNIVWMILWLIASFYMPSHGFIVSGCIMGTGAFCCAAELYLNWRYWPRPPMVGGGGTAGSHGARNRKHRQLASTATSSAAGTPAAVSVSQSFAAPAGGGGGGDGEVIISVTRVPQRTPSNLPKRRNGGGAGGHLDVSGSTQQPSYTTNSSAEVSAVPTPTSNNTTAVNAGGMASSAFERSHVVHVPTTTTTTPAQQTPPNNSPSDKKKSPRLTLNTLITKCYALVPSIYTLLAIRTLHSRKWQLIAAHDVYREVRQINGPPSGFGIAGMGQTMMAASTRQRGAGDAAAAAAKGGRDAITGGDRKQGDDRRGGGGGRHATDKANNGAAPNSNAGGQLGAPAGQSLGLSRDLGKSIAALRNRASRLVFVNAKKTAATGGGGAGGLARGGGDEGDNDGQAAKPGSKKTKKRTRRPPPSAKKLLPLEAIYLYEANAALMMLALAAIFSTQVTFLISCDDTRNFYFTPFVKHAVTASDVEAFCRWSIGSHLLAPVSFCLLTGRPKHWLSTVIIIASAIASVIFTAVTRDRYSDIQPEILYQASQNMLVVILALVSSVGFRQLLERYHRQRFEQVITRQLKVWWLMEEKRALKRYVDALLPPSVRARLIHGKVLAGVAAEANRGGDEDESSDTDRDAVAMEGGAEGGGGGSKSRHGHHRGTLSIGGGTGAAGVGDGGIAGADRATEMLLGGSGGDRHFGGGGGDASALSSSAPDDLAGGLSTEALLLSNKRQRHTDALPSRKLNVIMDSTPCGTVTVIDIYDYIPYCQKQMPGDSVITVAMLHAELKSAAAKCCLDHSITYGDTFVTVSNLFRPQEMHAAISVHFVHEVFAALYPPPPPEPPQPAANVVVLTAGGMYVGPNGQLIPILQQPNGAHTMGFDATEVVEEVSQMTAAQHTAFLQAQYQQQLAVLQSLQQQQLQLQLYWQQNAAALDPQQQMALQQQVLQANTLYQQQAQVFQHCQNALSAAIYRQQIAALQHNPGDQLVVATAPPQSQPPVQYQWATMADGQQALVATAATPQMPAQQQLAHAPLQHQQQQVAQQQQPLVPPQAQPQQQIVSAPYFPDHHSHHPQLGSPPPPTTSAAPKMPQVRVAMHSGPLSGGVVGNHQLRYAIFGPTYYAATEHIMGLCGMDECFVMISESTIKSLGVHGKVHDASPIALEVDGSLMPPADMLLERVANAAAEEGRLGADEGGYAEEDPYAAYGYAQQGEVGEYTQQWGGDGGDGYPIIDATAGGIDWSGGVAEGDEAYYHSQEANQGGGIEGLPPLSEQQVVTDDTAWWANAQTAPTDASNAPHLLSNYGDAGRQISIANTLEASTSANAPAAAAARRSVVFGASTNSRDGSAISIPVGRAPTDGTIGGNVPPSSSAAGATASDEQQQQQLAATTTLYVFTCVELFPSAELDAIMEEGKRRHHASARVLGADEGRRGKQRKKHQDRKGRTNHPDDHQNHPTRGPADFGGCDDDRDANGGVSNASFASDVSSVIAAADDDDLLSDLEGRGDDAGDVDGQGLFERPSLLPKRAAHNAPDEDGEEMRDVTAAENDANELRAMQADAIVPEQLSPEFTAKILTRRREEALRQTGGHVWLLGFDNRFVNDQIHKAFTLYHYSHANYYSHLMANILAAFLIIFCLVVVIAETGGLADVIAGNHEAYTWDCDGPVADCTFTSPYGNAWGKSLSSALFLVSLFFVITSLVIQVRTRSIVNKELNSFAPKGTYNGPPLPPDLANAVAAASASAAAKKASNVASTSPLARTSPATGAFSAGNGASPTTTASPTPATSPKGTAGMTIPFLAHVGIRIKRHTLLPHFEAVLKFDISLCFSKVFYAFVHLDRFLLPYLIVATCLFAGSLSRPSIIGNSTILILEVLVVYVLFSPAPAWGAVINYVFTFIMYLLSAGIVHGVSRWAFVITTLASVLAAAVVSLAISNQSMVSFAQFLSLALYKEALDAHRQVRKAVLEATVPAPLREEFAKLRTAISGERLFRGEAAIGTILVQDMILVEVRTNAIRSPTMLIGLTRGGSDATVDAVTLLTYCQRQVEKALAIANKRTASVVSQFIAEGKGIYRHKSPASSAAAALLAKTRHWLTIVRLVGDTATIAGPIAYDEPQPQREEAVLCLIVFLRTLAILQRDSRKSIGSRRLQASPSLTASKPLIASSQQQTSKKKQKQQRSAINAAAQSSDDVLLGVSPTPTHGGEGDLFGAASGLPMGRASTEALPMLTMGGFGTPAAAAIVSPAAGTPLYANSASSNQPSSLTAVLEAQLLRNSREGRHSNGGWEGSDGLGNTTVTAGSGGAAFPPNSSANTAFAVSPTVATDVFPIFASGMTDATEVRGRRGGGGGRGGGMATATNHTKGGGTVSSGAGYPVIYTAAAVCDLGITVMHNSLYPTFDILGNAAYRSTGLLRAAPNGALVVTEAIAKIYQYSDLVALAIRMESDRVAVLRSHVRKGKGSSAISKAGLVGDPLNDADAHSSGTSGTKASPGQGPIRPSLQRASEDNSTAVSPQITPGTTPGNATPGIGLTPPAGPGAHNWLLSDTTAAPTPGSMSHQTIGVARLVSSSGLGSSDDMTPTGTASPPIAVHQQHDPMSASFLDNGDSLRHNHSHTVFEPLQLWRVKGLGSVAVHQLKRPR